MNRYLVILSNGQELRCDGIEYAFWWLKNRMEYDQRLTGKVYELVEVKP